MNDDNSNIREVITDFLGSFKTIINARNPENHKIKDIFLQTEWKPENYHVPQMHAGKNSTLEAEPVRMARYAEIWIDDTCIWRKSRRFTPKESRDKSLVKEGDERMMEEILREMVHFGINSIWRFITTKQCG